MSILSQQILFHKFYWGDFSYCVKKEPLGYKNRRGCKKGVDFPSKTAIYYCPIPDYFQRHEGEKRWNITDRNCSLHLTACTTRWMIFITLMPEGAAYRIRRSGCCMPCVKVGETPTQRELCAAWYYAPQTLNSALKSMERGGLLRLLPMPGSQKNKRIALTQEGEALKRRVVGPLIEAEIRAGEWLSPRRRPSAHRPYSPLCEVFAA